MKNYVVRKIVSFSVDYTIKASNDQEALIRVRDQAEGEEFRVNEQTTKYKVLTPDDEPEV